MSRCAWPVLAIVAAACGNSGNPPAPASATQPAPASATPASATPSGSAASKATAAASDGPCELLPFAESTPVPEASAAAWLTVNGKPALLVVSDSGNHGAYAIVDADAGATIETGTLPLSDEASDDLEGLAARGDLIYGLTSSGWMRVWRRHGAGFEGVGKPYPIGPVTLPDTAHKHRAPTGDGMACNGRVVNCGRNYEGLCLAPRPSPGGCLGFAASKADGHLYCLTEEPGAKSPGAKASAEPAHLVAHRDRAIAIARPGALADCTFADDNTLWVGSNLFDFGNVYQVTGWDDPAHAQVDRLAALAIGFPELLAVRGDVIYRMSDLGGAPSLMAKYRCRR